MSFVGRNYQSSSACGRLAAPGPSVENCGRNARWSSPSCLDATLRAGGAGSGGAGEVAGFGAGAMAGCRGGQLVVSTNGRVRAASSSHLDQRRTPSKSQLNGGQWASVYFISFILDSFQIGDKRGGGGGVSFMLSVPFQVLTHNALSPLPQFYGGGVRRGLGVLKVFAACFAPFKRPCLMHHSVVSLSP